MVVLLFASNFTALAGLYTIGVVGAITVNLGSCTFNRTIDFTWYDRVLFGITLQFWPCRADARPHETRRPSIRSGNFGRRSRVAGLSLKLQGLTTLTVTREVAQMVTPDLAANMRPRLEEGQKIMVAARGITPVLSFAMDEAQLRKAMLFGVVRERSGGVHLQQPARRLAAPNGRMILKQTLSCARCSNSDGSVATT